MSTISIVLILHVSLGIRFPHLISHILTHSYTWLHNHVVYLPGHLILIGFVIFCISQAIVWAIFSEISLFHHGYLVKICSLTWTNGLSFILHRSAQKHSSLFKEDFFFTMHKSKVYSCNTFSLVYVPVLRIWPIILKTGFIMCLNNFKYKLSLFLQ